jgi:hypothetical protein
VSIHLSALERKHDLISLNEPESFVNGKDVPAREKLRLLIRAQIRMLDEHPETARGAFPLFYFLNESENSVIAENEASFIDAFSQILDDGARAGIFRKLDSLSATLIVRDFCMIWGISEAARTAANSSCDNFENRIMDILCFGIENNPE